MTNKSRGDRARMAAFLAALDDQDDLAQKRCKCGEVLGIGLNCRACSAERLRQNQPDEQTKRALAHGNREL